MDGKSASARYQDRNVGRPSARSGGDFSASCGRAERRRDPCAGRGRSPAPSASGRLRGRSFSALGPRGARWQRFWRSENHRLHPAGPFSSIGVQRSATAARHVCGASYPPSMARPMSSSRIRGEGRGARGVRVHRSLGLRPIDVTLRHRIPVTTPARTVADLTRAAERGWPGAPSDRELRKAIRQAGVLDLRLSDDAHGDRTRSDLEGDFLGLCRRHRLPTPEVNVRLGAHLVDFLWRERQFDRRNRQLPLSSRKGSIQRRSAP